MAILVPTIDPDRLTLDAVRQQAALIIAAACAPKPTRIHQEWKLKLDIGKVSSLLIPDGETMIHSWMIGTSRILTIAGPDGDFQYIGGMVADREPTLTIWGFFDYALEDPVTGYSSQKIAEDEAELIADYFKINRNMLGFDVKPAGLVKVKPMQIENIDTHSFSDGFEIVIAQCTLGIVIRR